MANKSKKSSKKATRKNSSSNGNGNGEEKRRGRKPKAANAPFSVGDPTAMIKANMSATEDTVNDLRADKVLKKSQLTKIGAQIAYRLALLGLVTCDDMARNAKDRTYKATGKTTMTAVKAALRAKPQPTAATA